MGYGLAQTSLAHTYGNVTCFIAEYIKNLFPENYFRTVHISSSIAYRQFNIFKNKKQEFLKKEKPMLIIRPRVEINDTDTFMYGTYLTSRITDNYMDRDFTNLQEFILDTDNGICIKYLMNRLKLLFDITIITETQMEQVNQAHYLKNRIRQDHPFYLQTCLESYIPKELLEMVAKDKGVSMYDENGSIKPFLNYINGVSIFPVSYKMKNSSGNDEFFRFYPVNIDTMFTGLSIDDGSKRGMADGIYTITFTVSTEFNATGLYYYFSENIEKIDKLVFDIKADNSGKIIPLFTIDNLYVDKLAEGWNVYMAPIYQVETQDKPDIMDVSPLFNNSIKRVIMHHLEHGIPMETMMRIIVMKDNKEMIPGRDYVFDYEELKLITKRVNMNSTYRMIVHINTFYINSLINDLYDLDEER